jgi:sugar O-acyltransferase (sialic acid O-acetyltransferase NeuD family)
VTLAVIGLGAGGHAKVVMEILALDKKVEIRGLLDPNRSLHGQDLLGVRVLGGDEMLERLRTQGVSHFFVGAGGIPNFSIRKRLFELGRHWGLQPVSAVHPAAVVSRSAMLGAGLTVMASVVVNASVGLGDNVVLNTGCVVEHDSQIGAHSHIGPGAVLAGGVRVGEEAQVGAGVTIRQGVQIGNGAVVGAGAVVIKDVAPWTLVAGVPARVLRQVMPGSRQDQGGSPAD